MIERSTRHCIHAHSYQSADQNIARETCGAFSAHVRANIKAARFVTFLLSKSREPLLAAYFDRAR